MNKVQKFPCPNCGAKAIRRYFIDQQTISTSCPNQQVMHTECPVCDYLMTTCYLNGNVLEAYGGNSYVVNKATSAKPYFSRQDYKKIRTILKK